MKRRTQVSSKEPSPRRTTFTPPSWAERPSAASASRNSRPRRRSGSRGPTNGRAVPRPPHVTFAFLPLPIDPTQQLLAAVLLGVIVLWITEPVPIPIGGLLGVAVVVFLGVAPADEVLGAVRVVDDLHVHRRVHPGPGDAQARRRAAVRVSDPQRCRAWASPPPGDRRVRRDHLRCCRRSSPTPRRSRCCCPPRSASSASSRS